MHFQEIGISKAIHFDAEVSLSWVYRRTCYTNHGDSCKLTWTRILSFISANDLYPLIHNQQQDGRHDVFLFIDFPYSNTRPIKFTVSQLLFTSHHTPSTFNEIAQRWPTNLNSHAQIFSIGLRSSGLATNRDLSVVLLATALKGVLKFDLSSQPSHTINDQRGAVNE